MPCLLEAVKKDQEKLEAQKKAYFEARLLKLAKELVLHKRKMAAALYARHRPWFLAYWHEYNKTPERRENKRQYVHTPHGKATRQAWIQKMKDQGLWENFKRRANAKYRAKQKAKKRQTAR